MHAGAGVGYNRHRKRNDLAKFLTNASMSWLSQGTYGIVLIVQSSGFTPYVDIWTGEPVHTILVKISLIKPPAASKQILRDVEWNSAPKHDICSSLKSNFQKEADLQLKLFAETARNPICPALLDVQFVSGIDLQHLFPLLHVKHSHDLEFGVIAMEIVPNSRTLLDIFINDPLQFDKYAALARAKLLQLGVLGYSHGDYHPGNVLVSGETIFLIDFGMTQPMAESDIIRIKRSIIKEDYVEALRLLMLRPVLAPSERNDPGERSPSLSADDKANLDHLASQHWANRSSVNSVLLKIGRKGPIFKNYETMFGWIFAFRAENSSKMYQNVQVLNLSKRQKHDITNAFLASYKNVSGPLAVRIRKSPVRRTRHRASGSESMTSSSHTRRSSLLI